MEVWDSVAYTERSLNTVYNLKLNYDPFRNAAEFP